MKPAPTSRGCVHQLRADTCRATRGIWLRGLTIVVVMLASVANLPAALAGNFSSAAPMKTARAGHTATLLASGKVLVAGGIDSNVNFLASAELYDPVSNTWSAAGNLGVARALAKATLLPSGKVLVVGGFNGIDSVTNADLYDPVSNSWSAASNLAAARALHTATLLLNGNVLVAMGGNALANDLASAELYNPASNSWSAAAMAGSVRDSHTATLLTSGNVLVAGGSDNVGALATAELYNPTTNSWGGAGKLVTARSENLTATLLLNGNVLVAGGDDGTNAIGSAELYNPASNSWNAAGNLRTARNTHTATLLLDGTVLVVGGDDGVNALASAELYNAASNSWSATGNLASARELHTATLLSNGKVLVVGGGAGAGALASAELYDPTPAALNVQGLWWNAAESGWGINFAHQGDQIFATWYTYDTTGKAWWLSMLAVRTTPASSTYTGAIYVDSGPPFNDYVGMGTPTAVGNGTLTFADVNDGNFTYTVNGVTQTRAITRFDLGTGPQPTCTYAASTPNFVAATNYQDLWWVPNGAESGWGVNFAHQGDSIFATWYTYNILGGTPLWLSALVQRQGTGNVYIGPIYQNSGPRFDAYDTTKVVANPVGTATFTFADGNDATFAYKVMVAPLPGPVTQSKQITRFLFGDSGGTVCQ